MGKFGHMYILLLLVEERKVDDRIHPHTLDNYLELSILHIRMSKADKYWDLILDSILWDIKEHKD